LTAGSLDSVSEIASWFKQHTRVDFGLTAPYRRRWYVGGCEPKHSLFDFPSDRWEVLGAGLLSTGHPLTRSDAGVEIELPERRVTVAVSRTVPGDGPPNGYAIFIGCSSQPDYVGDSPEVITELVRRLTQPETPLPDCSLLQVGFPGRPSGDMTYVGCWQWDVHSEARNEEFIHRAAQAIVDAIELRKANQ
jgi:hypothetical protein